MAQRTKKLEPPRKVVVYTRRSDGSWRETRLFTGMKFVIKDMPQGFLQCSTCKIGFPQWYFLCAKPNAKSRKSSLCIYCSKYCVSTTKEQRLCGYKMELVSAGHVPEAKP